jgi:hypothetical protein
MPLTSVPSPPKYNSHDNAHGAKRLTRFGQISLYEMALFSIFEPSLPWDLTLSGLEPAIVGNFPSGHSLPLQFRSILRQDTEVRERRGLTVVILLLLHDRREPGIKNVRTGSGLVGDSTLGSGALMVWHW